MAFARALANTSGAVFLYDTQEKKLNQVTSGFYNDAGPVFDPEGKYLYYVSGRTFEPSYGTDATWIYANTGNLVAVPLRVDVTSPLTPRNDVEEGKKDEAKKEDGKKEEAQKTGAGAKGDTANADKGEKKSEKPAKPEPVKIDFAGFEERVVILPPKAGRFADLQALAGKLFYRRLPRTGSDEEKSPVVFYDLKEREEKTIIGDADGYEIAAGGDKVLVFKKNDYALIDPKRRYRIREERSAACGSGCTRV